MARRKPIDFEKSLEKLEDLVTQMEEGELSLEESLKAFEKGIKLTRDCQQTLNEAEQKVQILLEENDKTSISDFPDQEKDNS